MWGTEDVQFVTQCWSTPNCSVFKDGSSLIMCILLQVFPWLGGHLQDTRPQFSFAQTTPRGEREQGGEKEGEGWERRWQGDRKRDGKGLWKGDWKGEAYFYFPIYIVCMRRRWCEKKISVFNIFMDAVSHPNKEEVDFWMLSLHIHVSMCTHLASTRMIVLFIFVVQERILLGWYPVNLNIQNRTWLFSWEWL